MHRVPHLQGLFQQPVKSDDSWAQLGVVCRHPHLGIRYERFWVCPARCNLLEETVRCMPEGKCDLHGKGFPGEEVLKEAGSRVLAR